MAVYGHLLNLLLSDPLCKQNQHRNHTGPSVNFKTAGLLSLNWGPFLGPGLGFWVPKPRDLV